MKVFIIGTGNVATTLGKAFSDAGITVNGVLGRSEKNTRLLAAKLHCKSYTDPASIPSDADVYMIALKDDAIEAIAKSLPALKGVVTHTAGAKPMNILKRFRNRGVIYPLETITKSHRVSLKKVPFCIESSNEHSFKILMNLVNDVSDEVFSLNSEKRAVLHLAAVFTNNFTNALLGIASGLLEKEELPLSLLKKLAESTVKNAFRYGANSSQTGPAKRNDLKTMKMHLDLMENNEEYRSIYRLLSRHIRSVHNKK